MLIASHGQEAGHKRREALCEDDAVIAIRNVPERLQQGLMGEREITAHPVRCLNLTHQRGKDRISIKHR